MLTCAVTVENAIIAAKRSIKGLLFIACGHFNNDCKNNNYIYSFRIFSYFRTSNKK